MTTDPDAVHWLGAVSLNLVSSREAVVAGNWVGRNVAGHTRAQRMNTILT